jgi:hypothetical protein
MWYVNDPRRLCCPRSEDHCHASLYALQAFSLQAFSLVLVLGQALGPEALLRAIARAASLHLDQCSVLDGLLDK